MPISRRGYEIGIKGQAIGLQHIEISPVPLLGIKMGFRPTQKSEAAIAVDFNEMNDGFTHPLVVVQGDIRDFFYYFSETDLG